jgi:type VI secretion system protein VasD
MLTRRRVLAVAAAAVLPLIVAGCGGGPPSPGMVELTINAAADINPDGSGRASPVVIHVYQLAAPTQFQTVDFFQLIDKEQAALGADLVAREEVTIAPNGTQVLTLTLKPNTQSIGIAASFRYIEKASWRAVMQVPPTKTTKLKADVTKLEVTLAKS